MFEGLFLHILSNTWSFLFFFAIIIITVTVILSGYEMIKHCGSNLHSLITNDVGHRFMYLAIGISSLEKSIPLLLFFIELSFCD